MGWTTVKCAKCETEYDVQMYGPHSQRDYRVSTWIGTCDACKATASQSTLSSDLVGSPKQIAWATTIRQAFMTTWDDISTRLPAGADDLRTKIDAFFESETSAKFWIDHRNLDLETLVKERVAK